MNDRANDRPILVMAGGTGGHVYPALAVAHALQQRSRDIVWLGTHRGIESRVVPAAGIDVEWISVAGLRQKGMLAILVAPFRLTLALLQSLRVMFRHRPAAVLGMGGFVSGPGGLAAWLTRRPLVIHEQNAVAGLTNRLLARLARVVLQAFPGSFSATVVSETVGNPVRADIAALDDPAVRYADRAGPLRLLVLGGSQGALALNRTVPAALALLPASMRPRVRHQAGERTLEIAGCCLRRARRRGGALPIYRRHGCRLRVGGPGRLPGWSTNGGRAGCRRIARHICALSSRCRRSPDGQCQRHGRGRRGCAAVRE